MEVPVNWQRYLTLPVALAVAVTIAIVAAMLALSQCDKRRSAAAQGRVESSQAAAASNSAADAINTVAASGEQQAASEDLTRSNDKEIRNAQGANQAVDPAVRDAGLRSLCRRAASAHDPKCQLLNAPAR